MDASATTTKNKLRRNSIGLALVVFMVISAAAPLTGVAGAIPIAMLLGNGAGIPGTVIVMTVVMLVWAVGFVALSRKIKNAGAFYAYSSRAVSGRLGGAVGLMALLTYNTVMFGLLGMLGGVAQGVFGGQGPLGRQFLVHPRLEQGPAQNQKKHSVKHPHDTHGLR